MKRWSTSIEKCFNQCYLQQKFKRDSFSLFYDLLPLLLISGRLLVCNLDSIDKVSNEDDENHDLQIQCCYIIVLLSEAEVIAKCTGVSAVLRFLTFLLMLGLVQSLSTCLLDYRNNPVFKCLGHSGISSISQLCVMIIRLSQLTSVNIEARKMTSTCCVLIQRRPSKLNFKMTVKIKLFVKFRFPLSLNLQSSVPKVCNNKREFPIQMLKLPRYNCMRHAQLP